MSTLLTVATSATSSARSPAVRRLLPFSAVPSATASKFLSSGDGFWGGGFWQRKSVSEVTSNRAGPRQSLETIVTGKRTVIPDE